MNAHAIVFVTILALTSQLCVSAEDTPTLSLANGNKYSLLEKSGLNLNKGKLIREGVRTSDGILDKSLRVVVAPGKSFTINEHRISGSSGTGAVGVEADESVILFFSFIAECPNAQDVKAKVQELGAAIGFNSKDFDMAFDSGVLAQGRSWTAMDDRTPPCWAIEVRNRSAPELPYYINVWFAWDKAWLRKIAPGPYISRMLKK